MVNEAVIAGLRNALERGEEIDSAIRSMISAGYDRFEVNEAAKIIIKEIAELQIPEGQRPQAQSTQVPMKKKSNKAILITAIIFLLITLGGLSYFLITKFI